MYSGVGKLAARKILNDFDDLLIKLFGVNMTDVKLSREEAISLVLEHETVEEAVFFFSMRRQLKPLEMEKASKS